MAAVTKSILPEAPSSERIKPSVYIERLEDRIRELEKTNAELMSEIAELKRTPTEQERERLRLMTARVHQMEAKHVDDTHALRRLISKLGQEAARLAPSKDKAVPVGPPPLEPAEGPDPRMPLTNEEIRDLLGATLHGPLPSRTMSRMFATISEVPELRRQLIQRKRGDKTRKPSGKR